jgi:superfamily II DNA or RNA helicase
VIFAIIYPLKVGVSMEQKLYEKLINDGILKKHNLKAYLKVIKEFEKSNIVGIVHATGTGKSFIALQLMYDNNGKKILYIVPRSGIRNQIEEHINSLSSNARDEYFSGLTIYTFHKLINMSREEIIDALQDDKLVDYIQPWLLEYIVNFVILNYKENE